MILGTDWRVPPDWPHVLAVSSRQWVPGETDWRSCTDVRVEVIDRDDRRQQLDGWPLCVWLAAEIADWAGVVWVCSPQAIYDEPEPRINIRDLVWDVIGDGTPSPPWWTVERQFVHDQRHDRFIRAEAVRRGWQFVVAGSGDVRAGIPR